MCEKMRVALLVIALFCTPAALADVTGWVVAVTDGDTIKDLDGGIDRCFFKVTRSIFYPYSLHQEKLRPYFEEYI